MKTPNTPSQESPVSDPHVAVVVLAHNGRKDTMDCFASLERCDRRSATLILVDNASRDGTVEAVSERYPSVHILKQDDNLGFAEGNNVGIRHALELGADYVFLLNNDATVAADSLDRCVAAAEQLPDAGATCPLVYFAEPPTLVWYAGATFDPRRAHSGRMLGYRETDRGQFAATAETDRVAGAAVLFPRRALELVGMLDPALFFLYEDVDWSLRARALGLRLYVVPEAKAWHRVSATAGREHSALIAYYDTRNHLAVCRRHAPMRGVSAVIRELGILAVHVAGARRAQNPCAYLSAVLQGWRDGRYGRLGPRPEDGTGAAVDALAGR
jgi:GT2 family glycosyltransferase